MTFLTGNWNKMLINWHFNWSHSILLTFFNWNYSENMTYWFKWTSKSPRIVWMSDVDGSAQLFGIYLMRITQASIQAHSVYKYLHTAAAVCDDDNAEKPVQCPLIECWCVEKCVEVKTRWMHRNIDDDGVRAWTHRHARTHTPTQPLTHSIAHQEPTNIIVHSYAHICTKNSSVQKTE